MKHNVVITESALSNKVIKKFNELDGFISWINSSEFPENLFADQISINNYVFYGWDEIEDYLNKHI